MLIINKCNKVADQYYYLLLYLYQASLTNFISIFKFMTYQTKTYTEDLADFGFREQEEAKDLFQAWRESGLPIDFENNGVKIAFNMNSGYVFLTNSEYQVAMCVQGENNKLELQSFYSSPYEGKEGSFDELLEEYKDMHPEDQLWFLQIAENIDRQDEIPVLDEEED